MSVGKFGALFASIPFTIFAAIYCVMFVIVGKYHSRRIEITFLLLQLNSTLNSTTKFSHLCVPSALVGPSFIQFTNMN
jgi:nucleobase transporter 1/2